MPYLVKVKLSAAAAAAALVGCALAADSSVAAPGCTQTLSGAAGIPGAVASAPNGSTICLNNGNYGRVDLNGIRRSGYVRLRSASGRGALVRPQITNTDYVQLDSLTLSDVGVDGCSRNISFSNSTFQPNQPGLYFDASSCGGGVTNYVVDNVTFSNVDMANFEGRLNFRSVNGAAVRNSFFGNGGYADGIQTQGETRNLTIGPGNTFDGITQSFCDAGGGAHCDAIQPQGGGATSIIANYFKNGTTYIMAPDGTSHVTATDNVFDGGSNGYEYKIQFGSAASPVFRHNLMYDASAAFDSKSGEPATTNAQIKDNIVAGYSQFKTGGGNGCSSCAFSYNLFDDGGSATGSRNLIGRPSFVGGSHPRSYSGWKLAARSLGRNRASDGRDMGPRFPSLANSLPPPAFEVRLSSRRTQKLGRWVVVRVRCPTRPCRAKATGSLRVRNARGSRRFKMRKAYERVPKNKRVTLRLRLLRKSRKAARRALRRHRRVRAKVKVRVRDEAGHLVVGHRTIKLRR